MKRHLTQALALALAAIATPALAAAVASVCLPPSEKLSGVTLRMPHTEG